MDDIFTDSGTITPTFDDKTIHFRGFGNFIYEYNTSLKSLKRLLPNFNLPLVGGEVVGERFIRGLTRDAVYVELSFDGTLLRKISLNQAGLGLIHTTPTTITAYGEDVFLAERQLRFFNTTNGIDNYYLMPGEPKTMCVFNQEMYIANYPGALLWKYPLELFKGSGQEIDLTNPTYLVLDIGESQYRPTSSRCGKDFIVVGTEPKYGLYGGAFTYYSNKGDWYTIRNIVPNHNIEALAIEEGSGYRYVYLGTSAAGGSGTSTLNENAHLVKFDLNEQKIIYDIIPVKDKNNKTISYIEYDAGFLFVLMKNGNLYKINAATGNIIEQNKADKFKQIVKSKNGNIYAARKNDFGLINKATLEFKKIITFNQLTTLAADTITNEIFIISNDYLYGYKISFNSTKQKTHYPYQ